MKAVRMIPLVLAGALAACMVGPDYVRPPADVPAAFPGDSAHEGAGSAIDPKWWTLYRDATLDELVADALARNADIQLAVARIEEADANLRLVGAAFLPEIDLGAAGSRSRVSQKTAFPNQPPLVRNDVKLGLSTAYELDFWGQLRRTREAARAQALGSRFAHDVVALSLEGLVSQAYFSLRSLDAQLVLTEQTLATRTESLEVVRARVKAGLASDLDLNLALGALSDATAQARELARQRELAEHQLGTLTGRLDLKIAADALDIEMPALPAAGLPSDLLDRRPDLRQAETAIVAANAEIGVAKAAYFPAITLSASDGGQSEALASVLASGAHIWSVGLDAAMPLLDFGRTSARVDAAQARKNQALASYSGAVRTAFREVADALTTLRQTADIQHDLQDSVTAARRSLELVMIRYKSGYSSYSEVLDAQRTANVTEIALARNQLNLLAASVDLIKALGGGWQAQ